MLLYNSKDFVRSVQHLIPSHPHMFFSLICIYIYIYIYDIHWYTYSRCMIYKSIYLYIYVSIYSSKFLAFLLNPEVKQQAEDHSASWWWCHWMGLSNQRNDGATPCTMCFVYMMGSGLRKWRSRGSWVSPRAIKYIGCLSREQTSCSRVP